MVRTRLRERRKAKGLTQEKVAEAANISRAFYTEIESGRKSCLMDKWIKIAKCLDISESDLIAYITENQKGA